MSDIPEDVIKEMMFRLPVKSILKFRCISHSWLSFIDSPQFIKTYLSYANAKIIISDSSSLYALDINTLNSNVLELSFPPKTSNSQTIIMGSCNGILLLFHSLFEWDVSLQNPYTKSFHKIPYADCTWPGPENVGPILYGLGYDHLTDDYKVVRNVQFKTDLEKGFTSLVNVYSSKNKSWRKVESFPYFVKRNEMSEGFFIGGALHWVVSTSMAGVDQEILAFDLATEEYRLVEQPVYRNGDFLLNVYVLGECLAAGYDYSSMGCVDLWVMKEYGKVESWSKVISLRAADTGVDLLGYVKPVVYSECGKKVLLERDLRTLVWYDLENKSVESVEVGCGQVLMGFKSIVFSESLVKLGCHTTRNVERGAHERVAQENDHKSNRRRKKRDLFLSTGFKLKL